jgi:murein DD-endopeptidase MepM/ murein hydrolase activator NlpD
VRSLGRGLIVQRVGTAVLDIGNDPPLWASGVEPAEPLVKGVISWRWLTGTVLTGVTSILLMGIALVAALNSPNEFASAPNPSAAVAFALDGIVFGQKGDRIRPIQQPIASRQILQVSTVTKQGARDLIKLRPFAKINTTLTTPTDQIAKQIPAFDMLRVIGDGTAPTATAMIAPPATVLDDQFYGAKVEGEVSVKVSDFPVASVDLEPSAALSANDIEQIVRAASKSKSAASGSPANYLDAGPAAPDPASRAVRIETENVSNVAKTASATALDGSGVTEKVVSVAQTGDLAALFKASSITDPDAGKVIAALTPLADVARLRVGQKVRLAFTADDKAATPRLIRASIYQDGAHLATVARADNDNFIRADEPATPIDSVTATVSGPAPKNPAATFPTIYDAVYATALTQQMPKPLVDQLIRVLAFDVDLQAHIGPGDAMEVFHSLPDQTDTEAGDPEILFASLTLGGLTKRFYRYRTTDDGAVDYYDEQGQSAKKFLLRKPIVEGDITSGFGYRVHPILGERILHTGVDYAAERMTPIFAAGDGVVEEAGPNAGYGNFTLIKHNNGYETAYGHQTKFARGIAPGAKVRQGQVIGYVGSTGLSTGPHVHFEIRINGTPVDPLRVRLPQGRVLGGDVLTAFGAERKRIDDLLGLDPPPARLASAAASTKLASAN